MQWDPERDMLRPVDKGRLEPQAMLRTRAIQIGMKGSVSGFYVDHVTSVDDVTSLAHAVQDAHSQRKKPAKVAETMKKLEAAGRLPTERPYMPEIATADLVRLGMLPGGPDSPADMLAKLGKGKAAVHK